MATPIAVDPIASQQMGGFEMKSETTGRFLVLMQPESIKAGIKALSVDASLKVASFSDFGANPQEALSIKEGEGLVFEDLGVAVVSTLPDQTMAVSMAVARTGALQIIEPERVVYAVGPSSFNPDYLRGYRDAVNQLVGTILGETSRTTLSAAVAIDEASSTWGLQAVGAVQSRLAGRGIKVAILDTGLDLTHPDFLGRAIEARSFIDGQEAQDGNGHGTHCAGIAFGPVRPGRLPRFGIASEAQIFVGKVLNNAGRGADGSILAGMQWAVSNKCEIISMSLGAAVSQGQTYSAVFEQAAKRMLDLGSLVIAAAGNDSRRPASVAPVSHPANCPSIVAVAAVDQSLDVAYFSNGGLKPDGGAIDISGPGVDCYSSWPVPLSYKSDSGTSMATPHVAGVAALFAEADPQARGRQLQLQLMQAAKRLGGSSSDVGVGLVQAPR